MDPLRLGSVRRSGILLHPTSLPGPDGIGDLGAGARDFAAFLCAAGQTAWQVLPLVPTGYGDSPYQGLSAFAGNPLLVSLDLLVQEGLLDEGELAKRPDWPERSVDYGAVIAFKGRLLARAAARFFERASPDRRRDFVRFCAAHREWLPDFALFLSLKEQHGGAPWWSWEPEARGRNLAALATLEKELEPRIREHTFAQFAFFEQWSALRAFCRARDIALIGDLPLYLSLDSAEVWRSPDLFHLDASGAPTLVAGVPPDYFSATGQLWGNPLYRWPSLAHDGYRFFVERARAALAQVDVVRLDHFRGYQAYWAIPGGAATAIDGAWHEGPGASLFEALREALGPLPFVAENLGVITPEVEALRARFGLPGMAVLQFAFGNDPQGPSFRPHNYERACVAYSGTHDNDTVLGWWASAGGDSTRSADDVGREKAQALGYLAASGAQMNWTFIRALLASVAGTVVFPMQDVLGLGSEARMNRPGTAAGNWRFRIASSDLKPATAARLRELSELYGRASAASPPSSNR
jgi:4-alpha-glucanotransferase